MKRMARLNIACLTVLMVASYAYAEEDWPTTGSWVLNHLVTQKIVDGYDVRPITFEEDAYYGGQGTARRIDRIEFVDHDLALVFLWFGPKTGSKAFFSYQDYDFPLSTLKYRLLQIEPQNDPRTYGIALASAGDGTFLFMYGSGRGFVEAGVMRRASSE